MSVQTVLSGLNLERMYGLSPGTKGTVRNNGVSVLSGCPLIACVAGARKRKGEGKIGRARAQFRFPFSLPLSKRLTDTRLIRTPPLLRTVPFVPGESPYSLSKFNPTEDQ